MRAIPPGPPRTRCAAAARTGPSLPRTRAGHHPVARDPTRGGQRNPNDPGDRTSQHPAGVERPLLHGRLPGGPRGKLERVGTDIATVEARAANAALRHPRPQQHPFLGDQVVTVGLRGTHVDEQARCGREQEHDGRRRRRPSWLRRVLLLQRGRRRLVGARPLQMAMLRFATSWHRLRSLRIFRDKTGLRPPGPVEFNRGGLRLSTRFASLWTGWCCPAAPPRQRRSRSSCCANNMDLLT